MRITIAVLVLFICLFVGYGYVYADEYTYDENGRVIEIIHDDGTVTTYTYDDNGNIFSVSTVASDSNLNIEEPTTKTELTTEENPTTTEEQITDSKPTIEPATEDKDREEMFCTVLSRTLNTRLNNWLDILMYFSWKRSGFTKKTFPLFLKEAGIKYAIPQNPCSLKKLFETGHMEY